MTLGRQISGVPAGHWAPTPIIFLVFVKVNCWVFAPSDEPVRTQITIGWIAPSEDDIGGEFGALWVEWVLIGVPRVVLHNGRVPEIVENLDLILNIPVSRVLVPEVPEVLEVRQTDMARDIAGFERWKLDVHPVRHLVIVPVNGFLFVILWSVDLSENDIVRCYFLHLVHSWGRSS
jgi:hypothetical protein